MLETARVSWNKRRFELYGLMPPAGYLVQGYMDLTFVFLINNLDYLQIRNIPTIEAAYCCYVNSTKVSVRPVKRLKLIRSWRVLFNVVKSKYSDIMQCFLKALAHGLDDVSNNLFKCTNIPGIRLPFNYNL